MGYTNADFDNQDLAKVYEGEEKTGLVSGLHSDIQTADTMADLLLQIEEYEGENPTYRQISQCIVIDGEDYVSLTRYEDTAPEE